MSGCRRSKTRNWRQSGPASCIRQKGIRKPESRSVCAASPSDPRRTYGGMEESWRG
jgi:hypothetical protein